MKRILCTILIFIITVSSAALCKAESKKGCCKSYCLMEASSGTVIDESNSHEPLPIASVTKIMTILLIVEEIEKGTINENTIVTASEKAQSFGGSTIYLEAGEKMTVKDLLKGICIMSANDACVAMAEHICGSVEEFAERMNKRAEELGMKDTNFVNCNGLDEDSHYSSAYDVALMSRELLKHKMIFNYTTVWMDSLRNGKFALANTNKMIKYYPGATGLKTGSTSKAGCCLSASAKRDGMELIAVVLGADNSQNRFGAASELLNYGFNNYSVINFAQIENNIDTVPVKYGKANYVAVSMPKSQHLLVKKDKKNSVKTHINLNKNLEAPVKRGDIIGEAIVLLEGKTVQKFDLYAKNDVEKRKIFDNLKIISKKLISI